LPFHPILNPSFPNPAISDVHQRERGMTLTLLFVKVSNEELETEVENAIAEFKRYNQEYDEERVKEQVLCPMIFHLLFHCGYSTKEMNKSLLHAGLGDQLSSI
jgi:hypothetical protein